MKHLLAKHTPGETSLFVTPVSPLGEESCQGAIYTVLNQSRRVSATISRGCGLGCLAVAPTKPSVERDGTDEMSFVAKVDEMLLKRLLILVWGPDSTTDLLQDSKSRVGGGLHDVMTS